MSIQSEINRITGSRDQSFTALSNKGVSIQSGSTIDDLPGYIAALPETIKGSGAPTTSTAGLVGQHYFNTSATESPYEYVCTDATGGVYTWEPIGQKAINLTVGDADSGITSFRRAVYDPNSSTVRVYVSARNLSANILTTSVLGVIPEGYRPSSEASLMGFFVASDGAAHSYIGRVQTNGSICQNLGNTIRQVLLVGEYSL